MRIALFFTLMVFILSANAENEEKAVQWDTNYDKILKEAADQNKNILLFFHGSDWCPPCMKMQKEVFENEKFIDATSGKILFLDIDFPYKTKLSEEQLEHNKKVKKKFGLPDEYTQGFPQVIIINDNEEELYRKKGYSGQGPDYLVDIIMENADN